MDLNESESNSVENKVQTTKKQSFLDMLISFISGIFKKDPQKKELKVISKQLIKDGYKFFLFSSNKISAVFGEFIYNCYQNVAPARAFFMENGSVDLFKNYCIQYFLTDTQRKNLSLLTPDYIRSQLAKVHFNILSENCKKAYSDLEKEFTPEKISQVNQLFWGIQVFRNFCIHDFYNTLLFFAPSLKENEFKDNVHFINAAQKEAGNNVGDFIDASYNFMTITEWTTLFDFLKSLPGYKELDCIGIMKCASFLKTMEEKFALTRLFKLCMHNKDAFFGEPLKSVNIVTPYLESIYNQLKETLDNAFTYLRNNQINALMDKIFGDQIIPPLKEYSKAKSDLYEEMCAKNFEYCDQLGYVYAFDELFLSKEIYDFMNVFTLKAKSPKVEFLTKLTTVYNDLQESFVSLKDLEKSLDPNFPIGYKLNQFITKMEDEPDLSVKMAATIKELNDKAEEIFHDSFVSVNGLYLHFNELNEDYNAQKHTLIENWDAIDKILKKRCGELLCSITEHLTDFVTLLECYNQ